MELASLVLFLLVGLVCVALFALIPVAIVNAQRRTAARQAGVAGFAQHKEWEFRASDPALADRFTGAPFGRGTRRRAGNVLTGHHDGRAFVAFDYRYTTSSGDQSSTHVHSVVALNLGVRAPELAVGPTSTVRRWIDSLTGRDIAIGDPAFDADYTVHSPSPEFAVDVLRSEVREVMQHHPDLAWRITGDSLLVIRSGEHSPAEVETKLHVMDAILDRIPATVWERLRGEQPR